MKLWGRECHLLFVTACTACYYGVTYEPDYIEHIRWAGYLCGSNKIINFTQEDRAGTYMLKDQALHYEKFLVIEVTRRLFFTSYKVIGPVRNFYMFLPKEEQEASRKLWERKTENETNANR